MSDHGEHGKKPRCRGSSSPEFKAEIVQLCQQGDRSVGQVAKDFDLTEIAVLGETGRAGCRDQARAAVGLFGYPVYLQEAVLLSR